jgi:hypothetical protein
MGMKTIYFLYKILFCSVSIMQIDENLDGHIKWAALDAPQDGFSGHNSGNWVEADTAINAVWKLRKI